MVWRGEMPRPHRSGFRDLPAALRRERGWFGQASRGVWAPARWCSSRSGESASASWRRKRFEAREGGGEVDVPRPAGRESQPRLAAREGEPGGDAQRPHQSHGLHIRNGTLATGARLPARKAHWRIVPARTPQRREASAGPC